MINTTLKTLLAAGATVVAMGTAAQAVTVFNTLDITVANGAYAGMTGSGHFTYESEDVSGVGYEDLTPSNTDFAVNLYVSVAGYHGFETNEIEFPDFPEFSFLDGSIYHIDFAFFSGVNGVSEDLITDLGVYGGYFLEDLTETGANAYSVSLFLGYAPAVPLPAGLPLLAGGLLAFGGLRRRQKKA